MSSSLFARAPPARPSRQTLPYPLPDPYADDAAFELYDPRGLSFKTRSASSSSDLGPSRSTSIGSARAPAPSTHTPPSLARLRISTPPRSPKPERILDDPTPAGSTFNSPNPAVWSPAQDFLSAFSSQTIEADGDQPGFVVQGWTLGREIGSGAFGVVREASRLPLDGSGEVQRVAVKIVRHAPLHETVEEATDLRRSLSGIRVRPRGSTSLVGLGERSRSASSPGPPPFLRGAGPRLSTEHLPPSISSALSSSPPSSPNPTRQSPPSTLEQEISLWQRLAPHPHIVPLLSSHHSPEFSYIFMPLCSGGNLLSHLNSHAKSVSGSRGRRSHRESFLTPTKEETLTSSSSPVTSPSPVIAGLPLSHALPIFAQIVAGLHHLHTEGVTHGDIKLENILCDREGGGAGSWRIADFGLAEGGPPVGHTKTVSEGSGQGPEERRMGSLPYAAPELILPSASSPSILLPGGRRDPSIDIWALGCVLYALVSGQLPFFDTFEPRLRVMILRAEWERPASLTGESKEHGWVFELLEACLEKDVPRRWTISQILHHPWLISSRPPSTSRGRSRAGRRPPPLISARSFDSLSSPPRSGRESRSPSVAGRRKERSTSRGGVPLGPIELRSPSVVGRKERSTSRGPSWDREETRGRGGAGEGGVRTAGRASTRERSRVRVEGPY